MSTVKKNFSSLVAKTDNDVLSPKQQKFVDGFIDKYVQRTKKSKEWMVQNSPAFCDWLTIIAYRQSLKEIRYPIVSDRSLGSRIWDIDGNEYIDLAIGYGVSFLGHGHPEITKSIEEQLDQGIALGVQIEKTGELAKLVSDFTGMDRVFFSNTGTESIMSSLRIARAATGRDKIVIFQDAFHGHFDGIRGVVDENGKSRPKVLGTPPGMIDDVIILEYGTDKSLEIIKQYGDELAAVLVEPFQTRNPWLHVSKEYLEKMRSITKESGTALIFDEIITGFRIHVGGAQAYFDIKPDIIAYGKTVGGGMPISIVAGKSEFMNVVDGGAWFTDGFTPKTATHLGGTFCKHPLSIVSSLATLKYLIKNGNDLQKKVLCLIEKLANILNPYFEEKNLPLKVIYFGGVFQIQYTGQYGRTETGYPLAPIEMDLLFPMLVSKGIFAWEMRVCCFSIQHTEEDVLFIAQGVKDSIEELQEAGFSFQI